MPQPREESTVDQVRFQALIASITSFVSTHGISSLQVESEREDESLSQRESSPSDHVCICIFARPSS